MIYKASNANYELKINVICHNAHNYSISAIYEVLTVKGSMYYYHLNHLEKENKNAEERTFSKYLESTLKLASATVLS